MDADRLPQARDLTCSPNFGYRHFLKVLGDRKLEGADLSSIRAIYNGAEPISVELCNEFMQALAYTGLRKSAMYPVYGLAEACLAVAFPNRRGLPLDPGQPAQARPRRIHRAQPHRRARCGRVDVRRRSLPNMEVGIMDGARAAVPANQVGHIMIRGPNVTQGYFGDAEATALALGADGWLDTAISV